ncbi:MAG: hypothetical protein OHK0046_30610 [Anaerolineae bacterium]
MGHKNMKKWLYVLSTGYILTFFSEHMFWSRVLNGETLLTDYIFVWLAYSLSGLAMLTVIYRYRVNNILALFLAGALFGWITEGIIVQTAYESLPLSLSFTGLAWHASISVLVGWHLLPQALRQGGGQALRWIVAVGGFWGFWAVFWQFEDPATALTNAEFTLYAFGHTLPLMLAYFLADRTAATFDSPRWSAVAVTVFFGALFLIVSAFLPVVLVVLTPLLALILWALRRHRQQTAPDSATMIVGGAIPVWRYVMLLGIPFTASLVHALLGAVGFLETGYIVYIITVPLGFGLFFWSIWRFSRPKRPIQAQNPVETPGL